MACVVRVTVWGVRARAVPGALGRMATDRVRLRPGTSGLRFAKLLGTGDGRTFTVRDADPLHWAVLTVWDDEASAAAFTTGPVSRGWDRLAHERLDVTMTPLTSRGTWSRQTPFGTTLAAPESTGSGGAVASITRARLRPTRALGFWRAVPPVSEDLGKVPGLRLALGVGEAPIGLQGTFSVWDSANDLAEFAYRRRPHVDVVRRTAPERWYAEELFARFAVRQLTGTFNGRDLC